MAGPQFSGPNEKAECPRCHSYAGVLWFGSWRCFACGATGWKPQTDDEREVVPEKQKPDPGVLEPMPRIARRYLVEFKGQPFIAVGVLEMFDQYYDHAIGDVISIMGDSGLTIFFELAALIPVSQTGDEPGYLLIRIDPEREFDGLRVSVPQMDDLDRETLDKAYLLGQEEGQGGNETP